MRRGHAIVAMLWVCVLSIVNVGVMAWVEAISCRDVGPEEPCVRGPPLHEMGGFITPLVIALLGAQAAKTYEKKLANGGAPKP